MTSTPEISIITPVSRPANLPHLWKSINFPDFEWLVICDTDNLGTFLNPNEVVYDERIKYKILHSQDFRIGRSGNPQRNLGIEKATGKYVYFLDDDNIVHPNFYEAVGEHLTGSQGVVVSQVFKGGVTRLRANPASMIPGGVDTAQTILPREFIKDIRWDVHDYCADGHFFSRIYTENSDKFVFIDRSLSYYNYLR